MTLQEQIITMKRAKNFFNTRSRPNLDYEMLIINVSGSNYKDNATYSANILKITGIKPYPQDRIIFCRKRIWWLQQSVIFKYQQDAKLGRQEIFPHEKIFFTVLRKKPQNVSTHLTIESVHLLNSSFGAFQTFCSFQPYKKSICNSKFLETMFFQDM